MTGTASRHTPNQPPYAGDKRAPDRQSMDKRATHERATDKSDKADGKRTSEISDNGPGFRDPAQAGTSLPAPNAQGGRGLWIARQMSDLTIITTTAGSTITAAIPRR
jgi:hypothetical protein